MSPLRGQRVRDRAAEDLRKLAHARRQLAVCLRDDQFPDDFLSDRKIQAHDPPLLCLADVGAVVPILGLRAAVALPGVEKEPVAHVPLLYDARPVRVLRREGLESGGIAHDIAERIGDEKRQGQRAAAEVDQLLYASAAQHRGAQDFVPPLKLVKSVQHGVHHRFMIGGIQIQPVVSVAAEHTAGVAHGRDIQHVVPYLLRAGQQPCAADLHFSGGDLDLRQKPFQPVRDDPHAQFHGVLLPI